jgi:hypothetical protein
MKLALRPLAAALALALLAAGSSARAEFLLPDIKNENTAASYKTTYAATVVDDTTATFTVTIDNTTASPVPGGALTAFAFNLPWYVTAVTVGSSSFSDNNLYLNVNTPGAFGTFDVGLSTGNGSWQGGTVAEGVAAGATGTFTFNLTGNFTGITSGQLTAAFYGSLSTIGPNDTAGIFAARFQGLPGSDTQISTAVVPEPSSIAMAALGLGALGVYARRRRSR